MEVATLSDLCATTGGTLYDYASFSPALDHDQVRACGTRAACMALHAGQLGFCLAGSRLSSSGAWTARLLWWHGSFATS